MADSKMAIVVFSGTADKLQAAATMASGAAAMGIETHVFLTFWGVNAFRKSVIKEPLPMSPEYGDMAELMAKLMVEKNVPAWHEVFGMAKEIGDCHFHACTLTLELMGMTLDDLDPMVEDAIGVAAFMGMIPDAKVLFI